MNNFKNKAVRHLTCLAVVTSLSACTSTEDNNQPLQAVTSTTPTSHPTLVKTDILPLSDPDNKSGWLLNTVVSDEFEDNHLDEDRWYIVGKFENGKPVYKHPDKPNKKVWKGRAPSQFSGRNHRLEDGKLILETRWEPDFPFSEEIKIPVFGEPMKYANITTACIIARKSFKYGYLEVKSKAADAEISSAFWAMGPQLEIDFYEQFGDYRGQGKVDIDRQLWWSIRDWGDKRVRGKPTYTEKKDLGFRVADDFHVYGIEWDETGVKYYIDGKLFSQVTAEEVTAWARKNRDVDENYQGYVADRPINVWFDQETFPWNGLPESKADLELNSPEGKKDDGVVDFEIEYLRIWQKPSQLETQ
ncbi:family 16 glycosylhydrolase [Catenovulum maritimum]|nr:family 16 glycosylhydrolase [Catenovulum maritimum]